MKEVVSTLTRKGQVTLPAEVRRRLGVREGDKVAFVIDDEQIRVVLPRSVVARTAGMLSSSPPGRSSEEERAAAEQAIAEDVLRRGEHQ